MTTKYFVLPAAEITGHHKVKMFSIKSFPVEKLDSVFVKIKNKELTAIAVAEELAAAELAGVEPKPVEPIVSVYLTPEVDMEAKVVYELQDGRRVVHAIMSGKNQIDINRLTEQDEEYSELWLTDVGLNTKYVGLTRQEVIEKFPECFNMPLHNWAGDLPYEEYSKAELEAQSKEPVDMGI